jgi:hypothetical protein
MECAAQQATMHHSGLSTAAGRLRTHNVDANRATGAALRGRRREGEASGT